MTEPNVRTIGGKRFEVVTDPEILGKKCRPCDLEEEKKEIQDILEHMTETASAFKECVGLAANQVGEHKRLILVKLTEEGFIPMINPSIYCKTGGIQSKYELCLSFPGNPGKKIRRFKKIKVKYLGIEGEEYDIELKGIHARIVQHELDHLNGRLV